MVMALAPLQEFGLQNRIADGPSFCGCVYIPDFAWLVETVSKAFGPKVNDVMMEVMAQVLHKEQPQQQERQQQAATRLGNGKPSDAVKQQQQQQQQAELWQQQRPQQQQQQAADSRLAWAFQHLGLRCDSYRFLLEQLAMVAEVSTWPCLSWFRVCVQLFGHQVHCRRQQLPYVTAAAG